MICLPKRDERRNELPLFNAYRLFRVAVNLIMKARLPTAIKSWRKHSPEVAENWVHCIQNNYKITRDNKLRQFYFKLLHRILGTNKELKCYGITDCVKCVMCGENDSIEHAFLECQSFLKLCNEPLQWFNNVHKINVSLTPLQFF